VHKIAERLNNDPIISSFARIEVVAWDWGAGVPLEALASPQESVNRHLALPEDCELFVGIFRCKLGTPLPANDFRKVDGTPFHSGSEYEFHRAWDARRRGASRPAILIYRQDIPEGSCPDPVQYENLQHFFGQQPFKNGAQWTGSLNGYSDRADFSLKLEGHLRVLLRQHQPGIEQPFEIWLKRQATILSDNAGPRYTGNAHMETDIGEVFDWLLARQSAIGTLDKALEQVWGEIDRDAVFADDRKCLGLIAENLRNDAHWQSTPDFQFIVNAMKGIERKAWSELEAHDQAREKDKSIDEHGHRSFRLRQTAIHARHATELLESHAEVSRKRVLLLIGPAGQGKTHTVVHEIKRTLNADGIAVGVLGQTLGSGGDLWAAIRSKLGWQGTTEQLLDKLENEAANKKQRALIVIDALNETPNRNRWRTELSGMIGEVTRRPHLALVISVRTDYLKHVLPEVNEGEHLPWVKREHPGFAGIEPDALLRYFEFFGVKAPVAPPLGEFSNPLYVQLLAKSLKGNQLNHWLPSWLEVWEAWIRYLEQEAKDKSILNDPSRITPIRRTMSKLAQAMLDNGQFALSRPLADQIARTTAGAGGVIGFLCSSGALIDRLDDDDEVVEFGFERLSDTFLTDRLLETLFNGLGSKKEKHAALSEALANGGMLFPLVSRDWVEHPLYYRRSGLLEALCLAVPQYIGAEFPSLIPEGQEHGDFPFWELNNAFTDSLRWRNKPEEFGADSQSLFDMWKERSGSDELDELIRFALIPGHPFAMERIIHPWLLEQVNPGGRDSLWSVEIARMWSDEWSLGQLVKWARDAQLDGIHEEVALPAAQMLAWTCATSNNPLRHAAIKGLTRLLAACPSVLEKFLPDFLSVDDPYILEGVLVAVWGVLLDSADPKAAAWAAQLVYTSQFPEGNARWCHITLRHYARRIVEEAHRRGWLKDVDLSVVRPPYRSHLELDQVPSVDDIEAIDTSKGFSSILYSARGWGDFYRYIMGGNSASLEFSSTPLPISTEIPRPFVTSERMLSSRPLKKVFDLALAARFVSWNCRSLGWTAERFESFDTGHYTSQHGRSDGEGRTERIGKKYQWISWHTLLAFLSDNYAMHSGWNDEPCSYDTPDQVGVHLHDPARWLRLSAPTRNKSDNEFWHVTSLPQWPQPNLTDMTKWIKSASCDLPPADIVACIPALPKEWGDGAWLRIASEHIWESHFAPGQWGVGNDYRADIWWQITPLLIHAKDLPKLLQRIDKPDVLTRIAKSGRVDPANDWHIPITQWSTLQADWDDGFCNPSVDSWRVWLPVPWREFIGECGHPDRRDDHAPIKLPLPSLFQEWGLELDMRRGVVCYQGQVVFGLSGWVHGEEALFAKLDVLQKLLVTSNYTLLWWLRGERRAFLNMSNPHSNSVWADYNGLAYLSGNGHVQTISLRKVIER
jgi:hypothetical protein